MKRFPDNDAFALVLYAILILVALAIGAYFVYGMVAHPPGASPVKPVAQHACGCDDLPDLENRLNEVNAVIAAYQDEISKAQEFDAEQGKVTMYSDALKEYMQSNFQDAINAVKNPFARDGTAETGSDCQTTVSAPTECLRGSLQTHENVHAQFCLETIQKLKNQGTFSQTKTNFRDSLTIVQYWQDEMNGYKAEIGYINANIADANHNYDCQWVCDVDQKIYSDHSVCERSCRPTLGSTIHTGFRCFQHRTGYYPTNNVPEHG